MFQAIFTFITTFFNALNYYAKAVENTGKMAERASDAGVIVTTNFRDAQASMATANAEQAKERAQLAHYHRQKRLEEAKRDVMVVDAITAPTPKRK